MKERPILFSAPMVRAILDGRKTQTRRVVKPQPDLVMHANETGGHPLVGKYTPDDMGLGRLAKCIQCPYGHPGDRLWVRETWRPAAWRDEGYIAVDYRASPEENRTPWLDVPEDIWAEMWPRLTDEAQ